jgi:hypothetical protein
MCYDHFTGIAGLKILISKAGNPPKIKSGGDYGDLVTTLTNLIKRDKNLQVQSHAVQCLGNWESNFLFVFLCNVVYTL